MLLKERCAVRIGAFFDCDESKSGFVLFPVFKTPFGFCHGMSESRGFHLFFGSGLRKFAGH